MADQVALQAYNRGAYISTWAYDPSSQRFVLQGYTAPINDSKAAAEQMVLKFNWAVDSNDGGGGFAEAAGEALFTALMRGGQLPDGTPVSFVEVPVHFIGHSRGAVVNSEAVERLGALGINVDHVTTLDPHPAIGLQPLFGYQDFLADVNTWQNITFADNYWRQDLLYEDADFDGLPIPGTAQRELTESVLSGDGYTLEHSDTHLWYHGTIDLSASPSDGSVTVPTADWYNGVVMGPRTGIGFAFSRIGGRSRTENGGSDGLKGTSTRTSIPSQMWIANGDFRYNPIGQIDVSGFTYHGGTNDFGYETGFGNPFARLYHADVLIEDTAKTIQRHNTCFVPVMTSGATLQFRTRLNHLLDDANVIVSGFGETLTNISLTATADWATYSLNVSNWQGQAGTVEIRLTNAHYFGSSADIDDLQIIGTPKKRANIQLKPLPKTSYTNGEQLTIQWDLLNDLTTPGATVDLIWDSDRNPYNGSNSVAAAGLSSGTGQASFTINGLPLGTNHLYARITDSTGTFRRYDFLQSGVVIGNPVPPGSVTVALTDPISGVPSVSRNVNIKLLFNKPMQVGTLNSANIVVSGSLSGVHPSVFSFAADAKSLTFDPNADFSYGDLVTVSVSTNVLALDADKLALPYTTTFEVLPASLPVISVGGTLAANTTWTAGNVYLVTSDVTVNNGVTLTIEAGVVVKFSSQRRLTISGTLQLNSTAAQKVVFTSWRDDTYGGDSNGDGVSQGSAGDWRNLFYYNPANLLHDAVVRYGGNISGYMVYVGGSAGSLEIRDCVLENSNNQGVYADNSPWIHNNIIRNCSGAAVQLQGGGTVENNTISGNANRGIWLLGGTGTIQNNVITGNGTGVELNSAATVDGNTITGSTSWGVRNAGTGAVAIRNNTITGGTYGVEFGPGEPVYTGNTVSNVNRVIGVEGTLGQNVVWRDLGMPYLVYGDLTIPSGKTLTIEAGVVVKFDSQRSMHVSGTLQLNGTAAQKVVFTSWRDDTYGGDSNGDGPSQGSANDWRTLYYYNPANLLHDAVVRYGGNISGYMVYVGGSGVMGIQNSLFQNSSQDALSLQGGSAQALVSYCQFEAIGRDPLAVSSGQASVRFCTFSEYGGAAVHTTGSGLATVTQCNFLDAAKDFGIRNETATAVNGQSNWWGHVSGPSTVGPGTGVKVSANVNYSPWESSSIVPPVSGGPTIISTPNLSGIVGQPYNYDADRQASAVSSGPATWSKVLGPAEFSINPSSGLMTWTPLASGSYLIQIMAQDANGFDTQIFQVQVGFGGDTTPPRVTSFSAAFTGGPSVVDALLTVGFSERVLVDYGDIAILNSNNQTVAFGSYGYSVGNNTLTVSVPGIPTNQVYRLFLTDTITDLAFNPLDGEFNGYQFPTGNGGGGGMFAAQFKPRSGPVDPSPSVGQLSQLPDGSIQLSLTGETGYTYRLEYSADLSLWLPLATNLNTTGTIQILDPEATSLQRRFYRAVLIQ